MIVGRGVLTSQFYEDLPPYIPSLPFFKFCPIPPSMFPPTSTPTAHSVVLFLWLNGWSCHVWCTVLLNDNMNVHMSSPRTFIRVLCNKASNFIEWLVYQLPFNNPPFKNTPPPPFFARSPTLKTAKDPLYKQILPIHWFFVNLLLKIGLFSVPP